MNILRGALLGVSALLLAASSVVAGDSLDPLHLGREAPVQASYEQQARPYYGPLSVEHDSAVSVRTASDASGGGEGGNGGEAPASCESEIRADLAPETALSIDFVQDAAESIPNVHQEHHIAVTRERRVAYLCTIVLIPYDVKVVPTGMAPRAPNRVSPSSG